MGGFATKPENPSLVLRSQMVEGENTDSHRQSSDLHSHELSLCEHACMHAHTRVSTHTYTHFLKSLQLLPTVRYIDLGFQFSEIRCLLK